MKKMTHNDIRKVWFKFFTEKGHKIYESAPLIPVDDDSLLWINAGVAPLKKLFDGTIIPDSRRIVNIQKCIRTNDIENVGVTKRHLTFFEMMGNFSIGDYFKEEALEYAFELLTSEEYFNIPREKIFVSVYPTDEVAYQKWIDLGLEEDQIVRLEGNYWEIGEGPAGPDSEIFYDRGDRFDPDHTALDKFRKDEDQERFVEIWNNVFSQYNAKAGVDRENYEELPNKNIDTGAGLERWCTIFQDVDNIFETDLFRPIIKAIEEQTGILYANQTEFKIIADHVRAVTFALSDGAVFENVGRGYVLRRLLRRSVRSARKLGINEPFLYKLVSTVAEIMGEAYKELLETISDVRVMVLEEEKLFLKTLASGERRLREIVSRSPDGYVSGADTFRLYDTYGFPFELTLEILNELGFTTNKEEFDQYMLSQRSIAKNNAKTKTAMAAQKKVLLDFKEESQFVYGIYRLKSSVLAIVSKNSLEQNLKTDGYIILKRTCAYASSGGQVSDTGMIVGKSFKARILDVFKGPNGQHIHKVRLLDGVINVEDDCEIIIDKDKRKMIEANHTSVHLLHYALQQVLSSNIRQAGSYLDDDRLRLDFTYTKKISDDELLDVERYVNKMIADSFVVATEVMPINKAEELGAIALFSEKYEDIVRVVKVDKSIELCGGTHISNTRDIHSFAIFSLESKGSNLYRIEATTGSKIENTLFNIIKPFNDEIIKILIKSKEVLSEAKKEGIDLTFDVLIDHSKPVSYKDIIFNKNELNYIRNEYKLLEKKYEQEKQNRLMNNIDVYLAKKEIIKDENLFLLNVEDMPNELLKKLADEIVNRTPNAFVFFMNVRPDNSVNFIARSNSFINAGLAVKKAAFASDGNGGGSPTFAQGGGKNSDALEEIKESIRNIIHEEV